VNEPKSQLVSFTILYHVLYFLALQFLSSFLKFTVIIDFLYLHISFEHYFNKFTIELVIGGFEVNFFLPILSSLYY